jgi:uncharacterized protein (TIGR00251 family)
MAVPKTEARLALRVHPGARRNSIVSVSADLVDIKVAAPADKGKANAELVSFLAETLGVARSHVTIVRGELSRNKLISISGLTVEQAVLRLNGVVATKKDSPQGRLV